MRIGLSKNEYGTPVSAHICDTCGGDFTVCPAASVDSPDWDNCLADECDSYDPGRDADILFMSDKEIAETKPVVSLRKLQQRRQFQQQGTIPSKGNLSP